MEYNTGSILPEMTIQTALNPDETVDSQESNRHETSRLIGVKDRNEVVHAYLKKIRSSEEIDLLKEEVKNTLEYLHQKQQCIKMCCEELSSYDDVFSRGSYNLLTHLLWRFELCTLQMEEECKHANSIPDYDLNSSSDSDIDELESESEI